MPGRTKVRGKGTRKGTRKRRRRRFQKGGAWYNPASWNWTGKKPEVAGSIGTIPTTSQSMTPSPTPSPDSKLASVNMCDKCKSLIKSGECKLDIESSTQAGVAGVAAGATSAITNALQTSKDAIKNTQKAAADGIGKLAKQVEDADVVGEKQSSSSGEDVNMDKPMANPQSMAGGRRRKKRKRRKATKKRKGKKKRKRTRRRRR